VTGILKFALVLQVIGYIIYMFSFFISMGNTSGQSGTLFIIFLVTTIGFVIGLAILVSIIELRERFLDGSSSSYYASSTTSLRKTDYVPPTFPKSRTTGSFNIMESGGSLIEENQMNNGWTCECGIKNQSGTFSCINCGKQPR
jgi:hypothetical protein